jgi:hypothetical protein
MLKVDTCVVLRIDSTEVIGYVTERYEKDGETVYDIETDQEIIEGVARSQLVLFAEELPLC